MQVITVNIKKPLYGNFVYVNGNIVEKAIRTSSMLEIVIPNGRAIVDPKMWKENGKIMKKVFKIPNNPMTLYGGNVPIPPISKGKVITKIKEKETLKLF
jgi:hypothetical protein